MQHYDKNYFEYQKTIGLFGGEANLFKFKDYIKETDDILDFGCGGGYLLKSINTKGRKIGVDINMVALDVAEKNGVECYNALQKIEDDAVDVVISNHAIEHIENPSEAIREMIRVTRQGGRIVIVVPHEVDKTVATKDVNMHIHTFSPQNLYNLFLSVGLKEIKASRICHKWVPGYKHIQKALGWRVFHSMCYIYGGLRKGYQTRCIGLVEK